MECIVVVDVIIIIFVLLMSPLGLTVVPSIVQKSRQLQSCAVNVQLSLKLLVVLWHPECCLNTHSVLLLF